MTSGQYELANDHNTPLHARKNTPDINTKSGSRSVHSIPTGTYIFVANDVPTSPGETITANEIADSLLKEHFWAFTRGAPVRKRLNRGDRVLIYLAGLHRRYFVAKAVLASASNHPSRHEKAVLDALHLPFMTYTVRLHNVEIFNPPIHMKPLVPHLKFIREKRNYGLHLRLPIVPITEEDYQLICCCSSASPIE